MTMPFGKFKGLRVAHLPDEYLYWLYSLDNLREPLRSAVHAEWNDRFESVSTDSNAFALTDLDADDKALFAELVRAGYRTLALKYHPDQGGSSDVMIRLTRLMERLRGALAA